MQSFSSRVHIPLSKAALIHDFVVFVVTFNRVFGLILFEFDRLPIFFFLVSQLLCRSCYLELGSWFPSAAFTIHLLTWWRCDSQGQSLFHYFMSLHPTSNLRIFHLFHGFVCSSFYVFNPILFLQSLLCQFHHRIVLERDVAVLIVVCVFELCPSSFSSSVLPKSSVSSFSLVSVFSFPDLFVSPLRLDEEAKHLRCVD